MLFRSPHRIESTIEAMAAAQADPDDGQAAAATRQMIADCDTKMARYRAAIDAGGDLEEITGWINEAKAERRLAEAALRAAPTAPHRLTREEIRAIVDRFASLAAVVRNAAPADKAEIYQGLNLVLSYQPEARTVRAEAQLSTDSRGAKVGVRGGT